MDVASVGNHWYRLGILEPPGPTVEIRGCLLRYRRGGVNDPPASGSSRGEIRQFTSASRLRMLKYLATVKLASYENSLFVTLTYPPEKEKARYKQRSQHRQLWLRKVEGHLGVKVCGLWRTEWVPRQSGQTEGDIAPHLHVILFGVKRLPWQTVRKWWTSVIHHKGYCHTWLEALEGAKQAGFYVAKYCGKVAECSLANGAYRGAIDGRHWGKIRPALVRRYPVESVIHCTQEQYDYLRYLANQMWPNNAIPDGESFTLLGEGIRDASSLLRAMSLDGEAIGV